MAGLVVAGCGASAGTARPAPDPVTSIAASTGGAGSRPVDDDPSADPGDGATPASVFTYPDPPDTPATDVENPAAADAIDRIVEGIGNGFFDAGGVTQLADVGDARHAWFVADLLRFFGADDGPLLVDAVTDLTGTSIRDDPDAARSPWLSVSNHLIAWDTPAYPGYRVDKAAIFVLVDDTWEQFFDDADSEIDWRTVSWGGVFADERPLGDAEPCPGGCIPALDDPATVEAVAGNWYPDDRTVFGIVVNGEALAIPLNVAEVHEMFNLTLGGRRLGIPYCTLCGSAQAYVTDDVAGLDEPAVLRTSGLLTRSNKVTYELSTGSVIDTFTGRAVSGPLRDADVVLEEITVVRSSWGEWKAEHPDTRIVARDGGIGRSYPADPLGDRDADGPIFPIGEVDPRLDAQTFVVGVETVEGGHVAFPSDVAGEVLDSGGPVERDGVALERSGDGLVAFDAATGEALTSHESFWFAWSQFHPDTTLWER